MASVVLNKILKIIKGAKDLGPYTIEYETQKRLNVRASKFVGKRSEVLSILSNLSQSLVIHKTDLKLGQGLQFQVKMEV